jgi:nucleotide-binding universal stress UspA family protein
MTIKTILVHITNDEHGARNLDVACTLAERHEAHVVGLHVTTIDVIPTYDSPYVQVPLEILEFKREVDEKNARAAKAIFDAGLAKTSCSGEWRVATGETALELAHQSRYADLTVVSNLDPNKAPISVATLPADLVLASGLPILAVPAVKPGKTIGKRILVAWNASPEAGRAVHDAMPLLSEADSVLVLVVGKAQPDRLLGADIATHLSRHDVKAEVEQVEAVTTSVEEIILSAAKAHGSDLVVAGAWGHSRLREWVLGGVTRYLVANATVPLFLSH